MTSPARIASPHAPHWLNASVRSLYPEDVLEAARRMDRQRREHDEHYTNGS
ncbi:MAG: hypothetical protein H0U02_11890 [Rubrobacter sp.]|nr:hypothetical protein [Rubrobacter sp.]